MRTRSKIRIALALILAVGGYVVMSLLSLGGYEAKTITIEQVSYPSNYKVKVPLRSGQHVHNLEIIVQGSINDTAMIGKTKIWPGTVDTVVYDADWYSSDYELQYKPYKATEGSLKVDLTFSYTD